MNTTLTVLAFELGDQDVSFNEDKFVMDNHKNNETSQDYNPIKREEFRFD